MFFLCTTAIKLQLDYPGPLILNGMYANTHGLIHESNRTRGAKGALTSYQTAILSKEMGEACLSTAYLIAFKIGRQTHHPYQGTASHAEHTQPQTAVCS